MLSKENDISITGNGAPSLTREEALGLWDELQEWEREFNVMVPSDRNFYIECGKMSEGTTIELVRKTDGARSSLNTLLADWYEFSEGSVFLCDASARKVHYPPHELPFRGSVLDLLHEIAHTHQEGTKYTFHSSVIDTIKDYTHDALFMMINPDLAVKVLSGELDIEVVMRQKTIDARHQSKAQWEEEAWEQALHMAKTLEKDGYNILAGFQSANEIVHHISLALLQHDITRQMYKLISSMGKPIKGDERAYIREEQIMRMLRKA